MTNREMLNDMSNDELEACIGGCGICGYIQDADPMWCDMMPDCTNCVVQWLGSEKRVGNDGK